ncbi:hypothetical protein PZB75_19395 [Streptomyces sp. AM 4-1-1]|uniref:hypothetical protein n=1 Tax=Streptomyces sp. AM 4-1-1 TaxID=3028710 RepID=UPI0023B8C2BC|nr:hypothetical protein [Streptomyces sp. AM 4-1-1]WEH35334.1 hypothetical protein PZB75_19395 [Streptomyces sp. AM 4-1-1]
MAVDLSFFRSETSQRLRSEGRVEGQAEAVLLILDRRGLPLTDEAVHRIRTCTDPDTLHHWLERAITATTTEELFAQE